MLFTEQACSTFCALLYTHRINQLFGEVRLDCLAKSSSRGPVKGCELGSGY